MKISELIKELQEIQKEHSCELDAINSLGDEIVEVKWLDEKPTKVKLVIDK